MTDFAKYHALGNDYIVVDPNHSDFVPSTSTVRLLCDRHFGIGGDGVLFGPIGWDDSGVRVDLRIFNSDGCECEKSGNGIRMFALYVAAQYLTGPQFTVRTVAGDSPVEVLDLEGGMVRVGMGAPSFEPTEIPVLDLSGPAIGWPLIVDGQALRVTSVNVGNPHTVIRSERVSAEAARALGPKIARHPRFPEGCNVQFMRVLDRGRIQIEIWERGSGYTLASGSSSCAAASAARALGLVDDRVQVNMPGGELTISFSADGAITMTGAAEPVAAGSFDPTFRRRLGMRAGAAGRRHAPAHTTDALHMPSASAGSAPTPRTGIYS
jgi:diaminopimelate epimerase